MRIDRIELRGSIQDFYVSDFQLFDGLFYNPGDTIDFTTVLGVSNINTDYWVHTSTISLSTDDKYSLDDIELDFFDHIIGGSGAIRHSSEVSLPEDLPDGIYYVGAIMNAGTYYCESNEENNFSYWPIYVGNKQANDVSIHLKNNPPATIYYPGSEYDVDFNLQATDTIFNIFEVSFNFRKQGSNESPGSLLDTVRWLSWGDTDIPVNLEFKIPSGIDTGYYEFELSCMPEVDSTDPDLSNNKTTFVVHVGDFAVDVNTINATEKNVQNVEVYPNPTNGWFSLKLPDSDAVYSVSIYNQACQLFYNNTYFTEQQNTLEISHYPKGIYFVQIMDEANTIRTIKLIKD